MRLLKLEGPIFPFYLISVIYTFLRFMKQAQCKALLLVCSAEFFKTKPYAVPLRSDILLFNLFHALCILTCQIRSRPGWAVRFRAPTRSKPQLAIAL